MEKEEIKEYLELARQSGKSETSNLAGDILKKMQAQIAETITNVVNGKIDKINTKLDSYIAEDNKWKAGVTPSIEIMKEMQGFASVSGWMFKTIIIIGGAFGAIYSFIKFIK